MNKSMLNAEKRAFSLAEALITLLIVCLITLASIPILTKKRRSLDDGAHGRWICTQHSLGHLVHWQKGVSVAAEDNPEEWSAGCTFVPPKDARNFAITVIGSGGGGASGVSEMQKVFDSEMGGAFSPEEDGDYIVLVVGAGGGGASGFYYGSSGCNSAAGGAGSAGSIFTGKVRLFKSETYSLEKGEGGNSILTSAKNGCVRDTNRAGSGGSSSLKSVGNNKLEIIAPGGQGGVDIQTGGYSTWCKKKCRGGDPGSSPALPTIKINGEDKTNSYMNDGESIVRQGTAGEKGGCNSPIVVNHTHTTGGKGFNVFNLGINSAATYGSGGNGSFGKDVVSSYASPDPVRNYLNKLEKGKNGYVGVFKIVRKQGQGGMNAEPEQVTVPSIEGAVRITLGGSVDADTDGQDTRVELFNKWGSRSRLIFSAGGAKGVAIKSDSPSNGSNSIWTDNGGGLKGASCVKKGKVPIYDTESTSVGDFYTVCVKNSCVIDAGESNTPPDLYPFSIGNPNKNDEVASEYSKVLNTNRVFAVTAKQVAEEIGKGYMRYFYSNASNTDIDYNKLLNKFLYNDKHIKEYSNFSRDITAQGKTYSKMQDHKYCFSDGKLNYVPDCAEEKTVSTASSAQRVIGYRENYECPTAGSGSRKAYGAGGGGGYAPDVLNFFGRGGMSSPGAVIIEW